MSSKKFRCPVCKVHYKTKARAHKCCEKIYENGIGDINPGELGHVQERAPGEKETESRSLIEGSGQQENPSGVPKREVMSL